MNKQQRIVAIIDEDGDFKTTYYDITNMEGELKDLSFESFDEYEEDMLSRGAKHITVIEHKI